MEDDKSICDLCTENLEIYNVTDVDSNFESVGNEYSNESVNTNNGLRGSQTSHKYDSSIGLVNKGIIDNEGGTINITNVVDDTKVILKCSISGEELDYKSRFTCNSCTNIYALRFKSDTEECENCNRTEREKNEGEILDLINRALEDNELTKQERKNIFSEAKRLRLTDSVVEELITIARNKDQDQSQFNPIHRIKFDSALKDLQLFRVEKSLKNLEMLKEVYPDNDLVIKYLNLAKSMTCEFDEILNLKYDDLFKDFTILLYHLKNKNFSEFEKKVVKHNHVLFQCAQVESEVLQSIKSSDYRQLDSLNEVLNTISDMRDNSVQNEDERAYANVIINFYQMVRDTERVSPIQDDFIKLQENSSFQNFESIFFKNITLWEKFHVYRIMNYPEFENYIEHRKKAKEFFENRELMLEEVNQIVQEIQQSEIMHYPNDESIEDVHNRYKRFKILIEKDFDINDDEKTITINNIKNVKWKVLEGHHEEQLGKVFQKVKNNYVDAIEKINIKQKEVELNRQKQRTDDVDELCNQIDDAIDQSDLEKAESLMKRLKEISPKSDISEVKTKIQNKINEQNQSIEKERVSLIIQYLKCFQGGLKLNTLFSSSNEQANYAKSKLMASLKNSDVISHLYSIRNNSIEVSGQDLEKMIDLNSIILKMVYPQDEFIQIGNQLWFCHNIENTSEKEKISKLISADDSSQWKGAASSKSGALCFGDNNSTVLYNGYSVTEIENSLPIGFKIPNSNEVRELSSLYMNIQKKKNKTDLDRLNKQNIEKYFSGQSKRRDPNIGFYHTERHFWLNTVSNNMGFSFFKKASSSDKQAYFKVNSNEIVIGKDTRDNGMHIRLIGAILTVDEALDFLTMLYKR